MNKKKIKIGDIVVFKYICTTQKGCKDYGKIIGIYSDKHCGDKYSIVGYDINNKKAGTQSHWYCDNEFELI